MKNKIFKNAILFIVILTLTLIASSCKNNLDLTVYVSEYRSAIYEGESDGYLVTVSVEEREDPFIIDGFVGSVKKILTVKLETKNNLIDDAKIELNYDGYFLSGNFIYSPLNGKYVAEIITEKLPSTPTILGKLTSGENECKIELKSKVISGNLNYTEVLEKVKIQEGKTVEKLFDSSSVSTEIHIRLICEKNKNYYYVGFCCKDGKTYAYLVDAKSGEILATKQN